MISSPRRLDRQLPVARSVVGACQINFAIAVVRVAPLKFLGMRHFPAHARFWREVPLIGFSTAVGLVLDWPETQNLRQTWGGDFDLTRSSTRAVFH